MSEAQRVYDAAMAPAWAALTAAKATGDKGHVYNVYHRDFEPVWFAADVAFRVVRDPAEEAFRQATGLEPWESFSDEPFDDAVGRAVMIIAQSHTAIPSNPNTSPVSLSRVGLQDNSTTRAIAPNGPRSHWETHSP